MTSSIAQAIRNNDFVAYQAARYPTIQDGEELRFVGEDFSGVDFLRFTMGFFVFVDCKLDGAQNIYGQPITFINSSVRNVDFRGAHAIIYATDSDFSGLSYDHETCFAYDRAAVSQFTNCTLDAAVRQFFSTQGVRFL